MNKLLANLLILMFSLCLLLLRPTPALRIKRASPDNAADNNNNSSSSGNITICSSTRARADQNTPATSATAAATSATPTAPVTAAAQETSDFAAYLFRSKNHMLAAESPLQARPHTLSPAGVGTAGQAGPPFVYYNKLVSPDGKEELKEFQLLAPNMIIGSLQHDMNYGPAADMGGVLLLNNGLAGGHLRPPAAKPSKHHHKHKSSSLAVPPFLLMLQQMLQPGLSVELDAQRNRLDAPHLWSSWSSSSRDGSNREFFEHLLLNEPDRELELNDIKDKDKLNDRDGVDLLALESAQSKTAFELGGKRKNDELVVTCPIRHEHHANNNGEIVDDDVVLVNGCHIV